MARSVYAAVLVPTPDKQDAGGDWYLGIATEGTLGYTPTTDYFETMQDAEEEAHRRNDGMEFTREEAARIVAGTM
jgi:hypothetical protein